MLVERIGVVGAGFAGVVQAVECPVVPEGERQVFGQIKACANQKTKTVGIQIRERGGNAVAVKIKLVLVVDQSRVRKPNIKMYPVIVGFV